MILASSDAHPPRLLRPRREVLPAAEFRDAGGGQQGPDPREEPEAAQRQQRRAAGGEGRRDEGPLLVK